MRHLLRFGIVGALLVGSASACFVRTERVVVATPATPTCARTVWIQGHYDPYGRWMPPHWQCVRAAY